MVALAMTLGMAGCSSQTFTAKGAIAAEGDLSNTWHTSFQGCTRDPFDALPDSETRSIATFVWQDPSFRDPAYDMNYHDPPDFPMRLEFSRGDEGPFASLHTLHHGGIRLDQKVCSTFRLATSEHPSTTPEGRPSLSGELALECAVKEGHITANLTFSGCNY